MPMPPSQVFVFGQAPGAGEKKLWQVLTTRARERGIDLRPLGTEWQAREENHA